VVNATIGLAANGLGYIGMPAAATFASHGKYVAYVDVKLSTVDAVNRGEVPFVEPDMVLVVSGAIRLGNLKASNTVVEADELKNLDPDQLIDKLVNGTRGARRQPEGAEAELATISATVRA
jgi:UDP-N-acetyl-D-mannosaminuronate dehydrogenase